MPTRLRIAALAALMVATLAPTGPASASRLLGTTGTAGNPSTLYEVDPLTGATTLIGGVGYAVIGMDFFEGVLYGVTPTSDPSFNGLITIDPLTGAGTPVGSGWGATRPDSAVVELAIDPAGNAFAWSVPNLDDLTAVDLGTGLIAGVVGDSGLDTGQLGLSFDDFGDLYLVNGDGNVHWIDTADGSSVLVGDLGVVAHHGDVDPDTGVYHGLGPPSTSQLHTADLASATLLGTVSTDRDLHTLAFVPEPSTGLLVGAGLLCLAALRRWRL